MIGAGIDAGSRALKIAVVDGETGTVLASGVADRGVEQISRYADFYDELLGQAKLSRGDVRQCIATGYGRELIELAETTITEITCHARGVRHLVPEVRTIIEIGGQDSKLIRLNERGSVQDFAMNDRCAAGTGRFLEVVAQRMGLPLEEMGHVAERSGNPASISSMCVVFAETEIIGLLAGGTPPEDIVAGVRRSMAGRVAAMAGRRMVEPVVFTGGVARIPGMAKALAEALGRPVQIAPTPQMTGALGAAFLACGA